MCFRSMQTAAPFMGSGGSGGVGLCRVSRQSHASGHGVDYAAYFRCPAFNII